MMALKVNDGMRTFTLVGTESTPASALTWSNAAQRNRRLREWRRAVIAAFGNQSRCIRLAWVLMDLFNAQLGYAFATDKYLAQEAGLALNKVQAMLTTLDRGGAIVRVQDVKDGRAQRRIYPCRDLMSPTVGGCLYPPAIGGTESE